MRRVKKWGKQGFLNPVDSDDDGWYKFSIVPRKGDRLGFSGLFAIADCTNRIDLDFDVWDVTVNTSDADLIARKRDIARRIKKIEAFRSAVLMALAKFEGALRAFDEEIDDLIDRRANDEPDD